MINDTPATIVGVADAGFRRRAASPRRRTSGCRCAAYYRAIGTRGLNNRAQPAVVDGRASCAHPRRSRARTRGVRDAVRATARRVSRDVHDISRARGRRAVQEPASEGRRAIRRTALLPIRRHRRPGSSPFSASSRCSHCSCVGQRRQPDARASVERQRDTAVRHSLGASRLRVVRMLLAEGMTLALLAAGRRVSRRVVDIARVVAPHRTAAGFLADARPDWTLAAYAMVAGAAGDDRVHVARRCAHGGCRCCRCSQPASRPSRPGGRGCRTRWSSCSCVLRCCCSPAPASPIARSRCATARRHRVRDRQPACC